MAKTIKRNRCQLINDNKTADTEEKFKIINALHDLWLKNPHLRFGQLICNIINKHSPSSNSDMFYSNNEDMLKFLKKGF